MNWRLLSASEKSANRAGRHTKRNESRREKRKVALFRSIASIATLVAMKAGEITPEECFDLGHAHGQKCLRIVRKARRIPVLMALDSPPLLEGTSPDLTQIDRPSRVLRRTNRGEMLSASLSDEKAAELAEILRRGFDCGRADFAAAVAIGQLQPARGMWALVDHEALLTVIAGLHIPKRLRRREYLVHLSAAESDGPRFVDVHGISYRGLFKVPVG